MSSIHIDSLKATLADIKEKIDDVAESAANSGGVSTIGQYTIAGDNVTYQSLLTKYNTEAESFSDITLVVSNTNVKKVWIVGKQFLKELKEGNHVNSLTSEPPSLSSFEGSFNAENKGVLASTGTFATFASSLSIDTSKYNTVLFTYKNVLYMQSYVQQVVFNTAYGNDSSNPVDSVANTYLSNAAYFTKVLDIPEPSVSTPEDHKLKEVTLTSEPTLANIVVNYKADKSLYGDLTIIKSTVDTSGDYLIDKARLEELSEVASGALPTTKPYKLGKGGGSSFLDKPTNIDDINTKQYFYFGWSALKLIRRQKKLDSSIENITVSNFDDSWNNRQTLEYV